MLNIQNLVKTYKNGHRAVDDLTLAVTHPPDVASPMGKGVEGSRLDGRPQRPLQTVGGRVAPRRSPDGGARPAC